jgi:hypothetical protein
VQKVGEYVRFQSVIPAPLNEMAILMAGRAWNAQFEFWAHRRLGKAAGLDGAIIDAIAEGRRPATMSGDERIVYDFCTELFRDKGAQPMRPRRSSIASASKVIDLIVAIGYHPRCRWSERDRHQTSCRRDPAPSLSLWRALHISARGSDMSAFVTNVRILDGLRGSASFSGGADRVTTALPPSSPGRTRPMPPAPP